MGYKKIVADVPEEVKEKLQEIANKEYGRNMTFAIEKMILEKYEEIKRNEENSRNV